MLYYYADGTKFSGSAINENETIGTYEYSDGIKCSGKFISNQLDNDVDVTYSDGNRYVGQFKNNKRHGNGTFIHVDGRGEYEGDFQENKFHGFGIMKFTDNIQYAQEYENGKRITSSLIK